MGQNFKTQMQYQGFYPKEAAELKQEYTKEVATIKSKYANATSEPLLLASADDTPVEERDALREAKQNYKTQMQYQGSYPKEAAELKQEYERKVAAIKSKYAAATAVFALVGVAAVFTAKRFRSAATLQEPLLVS